MTSSLLAHRAAGASQAAAASRRAANVKAVAATATRAPPSVDFSHVGSPSTYSFVEKNPGGEFDAGFSDYVKATQKLAEMQRLSQALLSNLEEINSLSLQTLPSFPSPDLEAQEARRVKRAAAREARKKNTSSALSSPLLTDSSSRPSQQRLEDQKQRLETAFIQSPVSKPSRRAPPRAISSSIEERQLGETMGLVAGPSLLPVPPSSSVSRGHGLVQAMPSDMARKANAKRAGVGRRGAATAGTMSGVVRTATRAGSASADGTTQFMKKAASLDLLNGVSEKELTTIVKDLLFLEGVKKELRGILKRNPSEEEWARAISMDAGTFVERLEAGQRAKAMMLKANYRLVISICKKYLNKGIALEDLIAEGMQGLLRGVEKFDPTKGFRFSTYAHWWIRQAVTRSLSDESRTVRLPAHMIELLGRIQTAKADLIDELGTEPSTADIAKRANMTAERVKEILDLVRPTSSLDAPAGGDDDGMATMKDMIEDTRSSADEVLEEAMLRKDLTKIIMDLPEREATVIRLRFGLDGEVETTLEDIGAMIGLTRERIRQIEAKAVRMLRLKQREAMSVLHDYSSSSLASYGVELASRKSQGTNKTG